MTDGAAGQAKASLAVVIPLYNKGPYIERALASVLAQTMAVSEIIVIDDGSTDDGYERVRRSQAVHPHIRLERQPNAGPGAARNAGLRLVTSRYVAFLDADDTIAPVFCERLLHALETAPEPAAGAWGRFNIIAAAGNLRLAPTVPAGTYVIGPRTPLPLARRLVQACTTSGGIMRTDTVRKYGGFFDRVRSLYGEDVHLRLKLLFGERVVIVADVVSTYHLDCSDLEVNHNLDVQPFLMWPEEVVAAVPTGNREILWRYLQAFAWRRCTSFALFGKRRDAEGLVRRFWLNPWKRSLGLWRVRAIAWAAPVLLRLRRVKQRLRVPVRISA